MTKILITGAAGFIGSHMMRFMGEQNVEVIGLDNLSQQPVNNFKLERLTSLGFDIEQIGENALIKSKNLSFIKLDLNDDQNLQSFFNEHEFDFVLHLAAKTGVRYSVEQPLSYIDNNIRSFCALLECCKNSSVQNVLYS